MWIDRRNMMHIGLVGASGAGVALTVAAGIAEAAPRRRTEKATAADETAPATAVASSTPLDLQKAIDAAAAAGRPLRLPAGRYQTGPLTLHAGTHIVGDAGLTELAFTGGKHFLRAEHAAGIRLQGLVLDGNLQPLSPDSADGLLTMMDCAGVELIDLIVRNSLLHGVSLTRCSGKVIDSTVTRCGGTGVRSVDAKALNLMHNVVTDCGNNGIQVWREKAGEDGSIVSGNRVERIAARAGGSGENGNGINVFRAGNVLLTGNRIADCAYSAIRGNAASNIQMVANNCQRLGEVALYAEFGFEGAVISGNVIETAATGIEVTNFSEGGRLAVVQGNLIRNLFRREHEPVDKRGEGIRVEADAVVSGNVIETAATAGLVVGWGRYMRNVMASGNLVRNARIGIMVTADPAAGQCVVSGNMISGARDGAIRSMDHGAALGQDLLKTKAGSLANVTLSGNIAT